MGQGAAGYIFLADGHGAVGVLQIVDGVDLTGVAVGGDQYQLIGCNNLALGAFELVELGGLVHVLLIGGDEEISILTLLNLLHQLGRALISEAEVHVWVRLLESSFQVFPGVAQRCCGEHLHLARNGASG